MQSGSEVSTGSEPGVLCHGVFHVPQMSSPGEYGSSRGATQPQISGSKFLWHEWYLRLELEVPSVQKTGFIQCEAHFGQGIGAYLTVSLCLKSPSFLGSHSATGFCQGCAGL